MNELPAGPCAARPGALSAGDLAGPVAGEPLAIVGIGCRFPGGANDPESYWRLLAGGVDAIREVPADRWDPRRYYDPHPGTPGKTLLRQGGFIDQIDRFDPAFFGISAREAHRMDPQQRLLLEVAWEALEDAGQKAECLAGSRTGVFVGISNPEYMSLDPSEAALCDQDVYSNPGEALSIAANRISYCLDLQGPSLAVDTACSSSLVAVHLACRSIWEGSCAQALAGGVNLLLKPKTWVSLSRLSMLSPDGRCKAFDASANGFVRGEGAGLVLLKPLAQARRDKDRVYAVVRASAVNQDGRTNGLTVPSEEAQLRLVQEACRSAGLQPRQVRYMEAHGTGTPVGDPIEARALGTALGQGRPADEPCLLGSAKTNIGHLESAAGIAGLIKAALVLHHRTVPPSLHCHTPNPAIPFEQLGLHVVRSLTPLPAGSEGEPALAGVNSFGFGGTNAHVILQEPPTSEDRAAAPTASPVARLVPLSARSPEALRETVTACASYLRAQGADTWDDICWSLSLRRSHHAHRLAAVAHSAEELADTLETVARGEKPLSVVSGSVGGGPHKLGFIFSGQGTQWWAMGRGLLQTEPVFRQFMEECDALLRQHAPWSLLEELGRDEQSSRLELTSLAQPAIFAVQAGLARLWASWGIKPDGVVGHSVGEVTAAYVGGALSLPDAIRVIYHRGRCMEIADAHGRMLAVGLSLDEANRLLQGKEDRISIAAINSPLTLTLSGEAQALEELARQLEAEDIFCNFLPVKYAFHSHQVDGSRDDLLRSLAGIAPQRAATPFYAAVTGRLAQGTEVDAGFWWQNVRQPVRFAQAMDAMLRDGFDVFVEVAPHAVLLSAAFECAHHRQVQATTLPSVRRGHPERPTMLRSLGVLYTLGFPVNWEALAPQEGALVRLPSYPWQRDSYWSETEVSRQVRIGAQYHPLLGQRQHSAQPAWQNILDRRAVRYLGDHRVEGHIVLPATGYLEMALRATGEVHGPGCRVLEQVEFTKACFLPEDGHVTLQFLMPKGTHFHVYTSSGQPDSPWTEHARGQARLAEGNGAVHSVRVEEVRARCPQEQTRDECYAQFREMGLEYGPAFQGLDHLWRGQGEALGLIRALPGVSDSPDHEVHPAVLDACLQVMISLVPADEDGGSGTYLPVGVERVRVYDRPRPPLWSHARLAGREGQALRADISVLDETGKLLIELEGVQCRRISLGKGAQSGPNVDDLVYRCEWVPQPHAGPHPDPAVVAQGLTEVRRLPAPAQVRQHLRTEEVLAGELLPPHPRLQEYFHAEDQLCSAYIWQAWQQLGVDLAQAREPFTRDQLAERLGAVPAYLRLLERHLRILEEDGVLRRVPETTSGNGEHPTRWEFVRPPAVADVEQTWQGLLFQHPRCYAALQLLRQWGGRLADLVRGQADAGQGISTDGTLSLLEQHFQDSLLFRPCNVLARQAVLALLEDAAATPAEQRPFRILELGGGSGGLSSYVLPRLPAERVEYVWTDVSPLFLSRAEERFAEYPFVRCRPLDLDADPLPQGFEPHSFDLILAGDVLHETTDLRTALRHVRHLLRPEGALLLIETVKHSRLADVVFGWADGWWRYRDTDLRTTSAVLPAARWQALLEECGFTGAVKLGDWDEEALGAAVFLARGPALADQHEAPVQEIEKAEPLPAPEGQLPLSSNGPVPGTGAWLILADRAGVGAQLADALRRRGLPGALLSLDELSSPTAPEQAAGRLRQLLQARMADLRQPCRGVVCPWDGDGEEPGLAGCQSMIHLGQALSHLDVSPSFRLWLVTRGAQPLPLPGTSAQAEEALVQAAAWGLGRVVMNEIPHLRPALVDLSPVPDQAEIEMLAEEIQLDHQEHEIAFRGAARHVLRLVRGDQANSAGPLAANQSFRLETSRWGGFDALLLRKVDRRQPGAGEVEIEIAAAGLNFSDVMKVLGLYPGLPDGPVPLGLECAGRVVAVGPDVEHLRLGDEVVAVALFSFARFVTTSAALVRRKPESWTAEEAATVPIAFLTAHYALNYMGRLARGERVLIHSATGGVGLAALQLARKAGAEVFATAGSAEKRDLLRALGVRHVMDSRSLSWADELNAATRGEGVDVILNSLPGEAIPRGIALLRDHGRFLEIGKRDIYDNSSIGLRPFRKNLSFFAIDLDRALRLQPHVCAALFAEIVQDAEAGQLTPLPFRTFPISHVAGAFRHMAKARHVGKVVVSVGEKDLPAAPPAGGSTSFKADASYLITGGLGGFGTAVARWMVDHGARHLVLVGRSGARTREAQQAVAALRQAGAEVRVVKADVADRDQLAQILAEVSASMPPLYGVVHAAMVLDDCLLVNLTPQRLRNVWAPKVTGAWNLHALTQEMDLDFFVLFSSISSLYGLPGQASYASANATLDGLAHYRCARGLPGLSINWGYLAEVGWVAQHEDVAQRFHTMGVEGFTPRQALLLLGKFLNDGSRQATVLRAHWPTVQRSSSPALAARLARLFEEAAARPEERTEQGAAPLRQVLLEAEPAERKALVQSLLVERVARVLSTSALKLDLEKPLRDLGMDSLVAMELTNWIQGELKLTVTVVDLLNTPHLAALRDRLVERIEQSTGSAATTPPADTPSPPAASEDSAEALLEQVDDYSDDEVAALLRVQLPQG